MNGIRSARGPVGFTGTRLPLMIFATIGDNPLNKPRFRITRTYEWINYTCLVIGLLVIWFSTHSFLGLLGGVIAALRYQEITVVTPDRYAEFHAEQM